MNYDIKQWHMQEIRYCHIKLSFVAEPSYFFFIIFIRFYLSTEYPISRSVYSNGQPLFDMCIHHSVNWYRLAHIDRCSASVFLWSDYSWFLSLIKTVELRCHIPIVVCIQIIQTARIIWQRYNDINHKSVNGAAVQFGWKHINYVHGLYNRAGAITLHQKICRLCVRIWIEPVFVGCYPKELSIVICPQVRQVSKLNKSIQRSTNWLPT